MPVLEERYNKLLIVAHADDEVIFAGEKLLQEKGQWEIVVVVTPDHRGIFKIPMFLENVSSYLDAKTELWSFQDTGFHAQIQGDIFTPILYKISSRSWQKILTHGQSGEYGHPHHIQVHHSVVKACKQINQLEKLYVFHPIKHDYCLKLSNSKRQLFENTYDDETNLPPQHHKKWVYGINTKQGWKENIVKYEE